jgi:hypothetical protein
LVWAFSSSLAGLNNPVGGSQCIRGNLGTNREALAALVSAVFIPTRLVDRSTFFALVSRKYPNL